MKTLSLLPLAFAHTRSTLCCVMKLSCGCTKYSGDLSWMSSHIKMVFSSSWHYSSNEIMECDQIKMWTNCSQTGLLCTMGVLAGVGVCWYSCVQVCVCLCFQETCCVEVQSGRVTSLCMEGKQPCETDGSGKGCGLCCVWGGCVCYCLKAIVVCVCVCVWRCAWCKDGAGGDQLSSVWVRVCSAETTKTYPVALTVIYCRINLYLEVALSGLLSGMIWNHDRLMMSIRVSSVYNRRRLIVIIIAQLMNMHWAVVECKSLD